MSLYEKPTGVQTRWFSFENSDQGRGKAGLENKSAKGHAFDQVLAGETKTLIAVRGSGLITRIWMTVSDRSPDMLRSLRLDFYWDDAEVPAVSAPLGDFFGISLGRKTVFENALFSDPEGRSFNCCIPMPFRTAARVTITNESDIRLPHLFYDIDTLMDVEHSPATLYFHTHWRRESPNELGKDLVILPKVTGQGRFLGCNLGILANPDYGGTWWGEGEVKVWFGDDENPTLCGTGTEDYIGTGWGQGSYSNRTQGCLIADKENRSWCFYRYHLDDPIYFDDACTIAIQTMGGTDRAKCIEMQKAGYSLIPVTIDTGLEGGFTKLLELENPLEMEAPHCPDGWVNFWRQDDWSSTAYFYLDTPSRCLPQLQPVQERTVGLVTVQEIKETL